MGAVTGAFGRLDVLVNNAGLLGSGPSVPFAETDVEEWEQVLRVNLTGPFLCSLAALPALRHTRGCVVNVSSGAAERTGFLSVAYGVSKAGLDRLTLGMARDLREEGVAVVSVRAPFTATPGALAVYGEEGLRGAAPPEVTARAIGLLLAHDPMRYTGRAVRVRELLEELGKG